MRSDMVSVLGLATMYANQAAYVIVRMDDRLSIIFFCNAMRSTHNTFAINRSITIDVLGTPEIEPLDYPVWMY